MAGVRQFDEERVLADVLEHFWKKGFAATSMQELAAVTGVQRGSLYNAYGNKEALFVAAYRRHQARYLETVREKLSAENLQQALTALFEHSINLVRTNGKGCLTSKTALDERASSPVICDLLRLQMDGLQACLTERLAVSPDRLRLPVEDAVNLIVTHTRGIVVMERIYDDPDRLRASARALIGLLLKD